MLKRTVLSKSVLLAFGGSAALLYGGAAFGQDATPATQPAPQQLQRVEITGSSIKRIDAETALPVQVITRQDIARTGASTVEELLQTVSSLSSSGGMSQSSAAGATTGGISSVSIHGLSSLRTLVLINGRRISPYGVGFSNDSVSVDVNSIPLAAIERIEILEDGASAIYGSDAIAGVINFILRKDFKGVEVTGEYGDTTHGGASLKRGSATLGFGDFAADKYNVMVVASLQKEQPLYGGQRSFAKSSIDFGHVNDTSSGNTFPANIAFADSANTTKYGALGNPTASTGCVAPYSSIDPFYGNTTCRFDPGSLVALVPDSKRASLFASGRLAVTNDIEAYAEASYNRNTINTIIQPVPLSDQFAIPATNVLANQFPYNTYNAPSAAILLTSASAFYPTAYVKSFTGGATPDLLVRYRDNLSGNRNFTDISEAPRMVLGVKGTSAGWDWDTSALYTSSTVTERVNSGYPTYSGILPILNSGNVNFFGDNSQEIVDAVQAAGFSGDAFKVKTAIASWTAKGSREVFQLPAGAVSVAVGTELRRESYDFTSSDALQTGDVSGYGGNFLPVDKGRNVYAAFAELVVPIVKTLEADFAARYDHYQNVGNSFTPKVGLRWQPVDAVLVRGSIGKGFRAPSLADLYAANTQSVSPTGLSDPLRCPTTKDGIRDCATQFTTVFGGNTDLKPEKSQNATLGIVLQPTANISVGVDYFRVHLKDTIVNGIDADTILSDPAKYSALITRGAPDVAGLPGPITSLLETNINLGETKLSGLEVSANWKLPTELGKFTVDAKGTYFITYNTENLDGTFSGNIDLPNGSTGGVIPRWKSYVSVDWSRGDWDASIAQTYQKGYNDTAGNFDDPANTRRVAAYIVYDGQATYTGVKNWKFTLGMRNIFDRDPPYVNTNAAFQSGYDPQYADPRGRFIYGRVTYAF
jgi:iron complex outermembrane recepter protein